MHPLEVAARQSRVRLEARSLSARSADDADLSDPTGMPPQYSRQESSPLMSEGRSDMTVPLGVRTVLPAAPE